jgi:lysophospholipase L1-like esterase
MAQRRRRSSRSRNREPFGLDLRDPWTAAGTVAIVLVVIATVWAAYVAANRPEPSTTGLGITIPEPPTYEYVPVTVQGDSYTYGVGAQPSRGYAKQLVSQLCWRPSLNAEAGTGYVNDGGGDGKSPFPTRAKGIASAETQLVIVQGSTNDNSAPPSEVTAAAVDTYRTLKADAPTAVIVAVGPTLVPSIDPVALAATRDAVADAARQEGVTFVDPIALGWLADPALYGEDGLHPTQAGHDEMAADLRGVLESMNLPRLSGCDPI